ncbi:Phage tail protein [Paenibacillus sp. UNCCL117]|uniref:phage distal tail protein n=1 Tax=unclassified Paenibacillus TaxID=185978 RepID=UPI00087E7419|nr:MULTISPECIES: phage tail family protein [unclassified Paenibacillus]SDC70198.1 Phage tail protein [Paenibacillus sp. cl123]SFW24133.1 Phage tail protein [Paenibacillus sp. UNCCL117]
MFNRGFYNRMPFNRFAVVDIYAAVRIDGFGDLTVRTVAEMYTGARIDGRGDLQADATREIFFAITMDGQGDLSATISREIFQGAIIDGQGDLSADARRYHVDVLEFTGNFAPGDKIVIDSKQLSVTKNGVNILHNFTGDFFNLNVGSNDFLYQDTAAGRSVLIRITHRDKFV